jgi:hypothetical protein
LAATGFVAGIAGLAATGFVAGIAGLAATGLAAIGLAAVRLAAGFATVFAGLVAAARLVVDGVAAERLIAVARLAMGLGFRVVCSVPGPAVATTVRSVPGALCARLLEAPSGLRNERAPSVLNRKNVSRAERWTSAQMRRLSLTGARDRSITSKAAPFEERVFGVCGVSMVRSSRARFHLLEISSMMLYRQAGA